MPDLQGTYHSSQDACVRRVFWQHFGQGKQATKILYAARTRPGRPEEDPYELKEEFLHRLLTFGCWVKQ
ncbi:hypothetical protein MUN82_08925 [Hymenobacter aerilatus]|uniref:Uncharacterized protein n=1 Tax=Hymenobacter aerilatus TaxID=2932251 RepID=A0A8T9T524_9BACT|nr:hypothetical protein [Hymenobacter aerilatus]UOR07206.1 hypothetical protein MUN82_08925 [Hymenobacter aerilatus]